MMTKEEILQAAEICVSDPTSCVGCPLLRRYATYAKCSGMSIFAKYIVDKEKEPTPAATEESSKKNILHDNGTTKNLICQVNEVKKILAAAELDGMSDEAVFLLGEVFGRLCAATEGENH